jgi:hypothetical protein
MSKLELALPFVALLCACAAPAEDQQPIEQPSGPVTTPPATGVPTGPPPEMNTAPPGLTYRVLRKGTGPEHPTKTTSQ